MIKCIHCKKNNTAIDQEGEVFKDGYFYECSCGKVFPFQSSRIEIIPETEEERAKEIEELEKEKAELNKEEYSLGQQ